MMRRANHPAPKQEVEPEDDELILSVKLRSGRFESSIQIPLFASEAEKQEFVEAWFKLMEAGINVGRSAREAKERSKAESVPPKDDA